MDAQFRCENEGRRRAVQNQAALNGIDYLEVVSADQRRLDVHFIHPLPVRIGQVPPLPAPALTADNLRIEGGVQVRNVRVVQVSDVGNVLRLTVSERGDFSTYTLRLVTSPTNANPPPGYDPALAAIAFSFKVACPSDFDCKDEPVCPPEELVEPEIDYLAKDYASFRRLMLDRLSIIMPDWRDRSPADLQIALVELLAYVGDHLSYYQDAVATEAYLGTARRRVSLRRHARLLDYFVHDGCNARAWVHLRVTPGGGADASTLPAGTELRTRGEDDYLVFETMHDVALHSAHNDVPFYTWSDAECCLLAGATRATLRNDPTLALQAGDVLILEEVCSPTTGLAADADPARRHAVRLTEVTPTTDPLDGTPIVEIAWHEDDALPFPLCLTARVPGAGGVPELKDVSLARGNVVLADQGRTIAGEALTPARVPEAGRYRPRLQQTDVTFAVPYDHRAAQQQAASPLLVQDPRAALPAVRLDDADETWRPQRDLLGSDRFAAEFVVEVERDGQAHLRFGDDVLGKAPSSGTVFAASYRVGNGPEGTVGAEAIAQVVGVAGIERVRNPMPAAGGTAREGMEAVRQYAPQAFRTQQRAVTEADYAEVTERLPSVQKAAARFRWTGSWYTVFVTIDRKGGRTLQDDARFQQEMRAHLDRFRMAGYDLKLNDPVFVPLDVLLSVCVDPGYFRSDVKQTLLQVFSRHDLPDGRRGFFHPDHFTFGQPVYLSRIYEAAMDVAGVASVEVRRFQRWGKTPAGEIAAGLLEPAALEVIRLDNDPSEPENGKIEFSMLGGL